MIRKLKMTENINGWRSYVIYSDISKETQFFQGSIKLPFYETINDNSEEILKILSEALSKPGDEGDTQ